MGTMTDNFHGINDFEWSPDGTKLYISKYRTGNPSIYSQAYGGLYQYDLNLPNNYPLLIYSPNLITSKALGLKLAPDGKIYFLFDSIYNYVQKIGTINSPNSAGINCNFNPQSINMGSTVLNNTQKFPEFLVSLDESPSEYININKK